MNLLIKSDKDTISTTDGKILFFGIEDYKDKIANGDCCFICGAEPDSKTFNNEHIIPDWILKKFNLNSESITLPNNTKINYGQYKVPCCKECNSELGEKFENPLSKLFSQSYSDIIKSITDDKSLIKLIFVWINLIYLKTHLKDKSLLLNRDIRKNSGSIGDLHYWEDIHHIHCLSRSHYTGAIIDKNVYGSIFIFPSAQLGDKPEFDYIDNSFGKAVMLQLGEFCIITVLNDACAGSSILSDKFKKINSSLNPLQVREIISHLVFINLNLKNRPVFKSRISFNGEYRIIGEIPETWYLLEENERLFTPGEILKDYAYRFLGDIENRETILEEIKEGKRGFMFNEKGEFIENSSD